MKYKIMFFAILGLLTGCNAVKNPPDHSDTPETIIQSEYRKISAEEARVIMSESTDYVLLDVRTESEYTEKRIEGAVLIPDYEIKARAEKELTDKDQVILVYCRSGRRSENAARELISMGYTQVYDFGGILDWDYDTVNE